MKYKPKPNYSVWKGERRHLVRSNKMIYNIYNDLRTLAIFMVPSSVIYIPISVGIAHAK